ncbi:hypothetical protein V1477_010371, partial [Vespula maculifrons]
MPGKKRRQAQSVKLNGAFRWSGKFERHRPSRRRRRRRRRRHRINTHIPTRLEHRMEDYSLIFSTCRRPFTNSESYIEFFRIHFLNHPSTFKFKYNLAPRLLLDDYTENAGDIQELWYFLTA